MNEKLLGLAKIMEKLREESGCPWDREQTHHTLKPYLIEEAYEVLEAIESGEDHHLKEELGDLLFQVVFHSHIAKESGRFTLDDVITSVSEKMIRRHPHVFGNEKVKDSADVLNNWEEIKRREKERGSILDGVPKQLPSLVRARRLQERAARVGFDWPSAEKVWEKVEEEWQELQDARKSGDTGNIMEEMGDLMIALVNLGRFIDIDGDEAMRRANEKFVRRFTAIEDELKSRGKSLYEATLDEMEEIWTREREKDNGKQGNAGQI